MPDLTTRTARRRLPPSKTRRWTRLARGRALGYRRPGSEAGGWYVRLYFADARPKAGDPYRTAALGTADDLAGADGDSVLSYGQAVERALAWSFRDGGAGRRHPLTVREAVASYLEWFSEHRRSLDRVRNLFEVRVLPELGALEVSALTPRRLRRWHQAIAEQPARLRGGQLREARTDDARRARKASANHALVALKAALNRAVAEELVDGPGVWSKVEAFRGVDVARERYLEPGEVQRLLNACPPDFRELVAAAIHTGCRYGELAALLVRDYLPHVQAVHVHTSKSGEPRKVFLSEEGAAFFDRVTAGRSQGETLLTKPDGSRWGRNHQARPTRDACAAAGLEPMGFHQLRHTYASLYVMAGGSLVALAKQLGHSGTRMVERHYAHLADSWRAEEARAHAPRVGAMGSRTRVVRMRQRVQASRPGASVAPEGRRPWPPGSPGVITPTEDK